MTSGVGGGWGSPKSRQKEQNQLICDSARGVGVKKSENVADVIYGSSLSRIRVSLTLQCCWKHFSFIVKEGQEPDIHTLEIA